MKLLKENNIHTAIESNGSTTAYPAVAELTDWLFTDLKTLNRELFVQRVSPQAELLNRVCENLRFAAQHQPCLVIRIPVISGLNDSIEEQTRLTDFCRELQGLRKDGVLTVQLLRQHHLAEPKYRALNRVSPCEKAEPPSRENIAAFAEMMKKYDINCSFFG